MDFNRIFCHESLAGIGVHYRIYGNCKFVLDGYGFGIDRNNGATNRVYFFNEFYATEFAVNRSTAKFLAKIANEKPGKGLLDGMMKKWISVNKHS